MSWGDRILGWIEPEDNPRNTVYGTITAGIVIAAEDPARETYPRVVVATAVAVLTYWVAHSYAHWVAERFRRDGVETRGQVRFRDALAHEWPLAEGAAIPVTALLLAAAAGAPLTTGAGAAVWTAGAALVGFELAGGLRRGVRARELVTNAALGLVLGAALLGLRLVLH